MHACVPISRCQLLLFYTMPSVLSRQQGVPHSRISPLDEGADRRVALNTHLPTNHTDGQRRTYMLGDDEIAAKAQAPSPSLRYIPSFF